MNIENVPEWAYSWCYYFAAIGILSVVSGILGLFMNKKVGFATSIIFFIASVIQAGTAMTLFWMCRRSLA